MKDLKKTKEFYDSFLQMGVPGFDVSVYVNGNEILRHMGGYSDLENKVPINGKERYNIYSCSKPITCTAAMQLYEKGLFSLEDKLSDYMPEFAEMTVGSADDVKRAESPILIKHLFEMTAGFDYNIASDEIKEAKMETGGKCPTRETMKYIAKRPLCFEPGTEWNYSLCHDVLAALVEVISGEKFECYTKKHIFDPLGMNETTFMLPDEELLTVSCQYRFNAAKNRAENCGKEIQGYKLGSEYASGGAGCISTVDDYMKFLEALRIGDVILGKDTINLMAKDRLTERQSQTYWTRETHGYGLGLRTPKAGSIFEDFGWGGAAGAFLAIDPKNGISIYGSQHLLSSPNQGIRGWVYRYIMAEYFDNNDFIKLIRDSLAPGEYNLTF